jgi:hypothetical protein
MSTDNEFDLEKLFLPAWAQEPSSSKQYAQYEVREERVFDHRRAERPNRPQERRPGGPGPRRDDRPGAPRGKRRERLGGRERPGKEGKEAQREHRERRDRREPPQPLPAIQLSLVPDEKGVESLARQIKMTGRAYPLFDIAQMILQKPERHAVSFQVEKNAEGNPIQPLFLCALDDTLWLSIEEAIGHVLKKHFNTFYQAERTPTEPPKGKYTFVAQCGVSGVILGPPNHHDYQNQLRKLHSERFSRMPFDVYKARVKIVRDEEVVKKWIDEQSFKTEYLCLNTPDSLRLGSMEAVEKHFRETHLENIVKAVEFHTISGTAARGLRSPQLVRLVRQAWDDQRRFPLQIATVLSQQFATHGLQFFKVNKTITHVSVARPHYLDLEATPVSEGIRKIVDFINVNPRCNRRQLLESLAPAPASAEGQEPSGSSPPQPSAEQTAVNADLHWLIHQGHVIEFANGTLETAKKPAPRPPKAETKPAGPAAPPASETTTSVPGTTTASVEPASPPGEMPVAEPEKPDAEQTQFVPTPPSTIQEFHRPSDAPAEPESKPGEHPSGEQSSIATSLAQPE